MGKLIEMQSQLQKTPRGGEVVAFFPKTDTREEALKALDWAITRCERLFKLESEPYLPTERTAFESFMTRLGPTLRECGDGVRLAMNTSWVKIEGMTTGHKVYVSRGKLAVNRVDSTLPPSLVPGAVTPTNKNGLIASWLPADVESVAYALRLITSRDTPPLLRK